MHSRLIGRNSDRIPESGRILWVNIPDSVDLPTEVLDRSTFLFQDHEKFTLSSREASRRLFADFPGPEERYSLAVLSLPKSKPRLTMMLHCLCSVIAPGGELWLVGQTRAGIRSADSAVGRYFAVRERLDNAARGQVIRAWQAACTPFDPLEYRSTWEIDAGVQKLRVASWPGVFAHGRLDEGTALLLRYADQAGIHGRVLDIGCGCGVIGAWIKARHPRVRLLMMDSDMLAVRAARETLALNGLEGTAVAGHTISGVGETFDMIISNPPFHDQFDTQSAKGMALLDTAGNFLRPGGQLLVVVNRHLPYRRWLGSTGLKHRIVADDGRYHVLQASL